MASLTYSLRRRLQILCCPLIPLASRLQCALSPHAVASLYVDQFIKRTSSGLHADIDSFSFDLPIQKPGDEPLSLRVFQQLIGEGFIDPTLFRGQVRLRPGDTVIDVGANIGTVTAIFSREVGAGGKVIAIEPIMADVLRHNIAQNNLPNVQVVECAMGNKFDTAEVSFAPGGLDTSLINHAPWRTYFRRITIKPLDSVAEELKLPSIDFIKVDVEGYEEQVIDGSRDLIKRFRPRWSISAYHNEQSGRPQYPALVRQLKGLGYQLDCIPGFHIYAW